MTRMTNDLTKPLAAALLLGTLSFAVGCANDGSADEGGECPSDEAFFDEQVWQPIASMSCYSCHNVEGAAKDSRMVLLGPDEADAVTTNMATMAAMAQEDVDGTSLLLLKPTSTHPDGHGGGMVFGTDSDQYAVFEEFVARARGTFECEDEAESGGDAGELVCGEDELAELGVRGIRRLSHIEYDNSVSDLVEVSGELAEQGTSFASDNVINGFTKNASVLTVSSLLADQYRQAAEALADHVVDNQVEYLGCDPAEGEACAESFVRAFGTRAFRRPITDSEVARYMDLFIDIDAEDGFDEGLRWTVSALLQSPNFLYRTELGVDAGDGSYALTAHEVAAELSYLILGTTPDDELVALAESGEILEPAVLEAQAERLLADPRSEQTLLRFVDEWLNITLLSSVTRDPDLYPEFSAEIRADMLGEIHRVASEVFYAGGSLADLMTVDFTYVTAELAAFYGVPAPDNVDAEGFGRVELDGVTYGGLLTQGALNATHAKPTTSSPIHRGVMVRERLLCQELPPPPASLDTSPPPVDPSLSTRERYEQHSSDPACAGCHELIDGIGFGLEHYDAIGRFRDYDGEHPVDAAGEIVRSQDIDGTFEGAAQLQDILAAGEEVQSCYVQMWAEYSLGAELEGELECVGDSLRERFAASEGRLDVLVDALVTSPHFLRRRADDGASSGSGDEGDEGESEDTGTSTDEGGETEGGEDTSDEGDEGSEGPSMTDGIEIEIMVDSMWGQGECDTVHVYNVTDAPISWEVSIELPGTLANYWNAVASVDAELTTFVGESHNSTVEAQGTVSFGYCVDY
ncbi:DUF1592 domain-containing protein [Pseudenhygromyxa sp. WMMC2535]|uniref:DUF1592 domain-containing protein n=1 Tax=Pseudenhygromyxa sp. WMMC2535 TaxID=2712867 RepID=UPI001557DD59|nr:DUF1592 domain-containing protein [Pseudenhygromyxa sp. WMMC2535]NVB39653.1 DUF1592 domain-containing protein [Pseudenhygromyxa sp. WMMC2535]